MDNQIITPPHYTNQQTSRWFRSHENFIGITCIYVPFSDTYPQM